MFKMNPEQLNWNPYRSEATNPLQRQILDALLNSFEKSKTEANETGFWQTGLSVVLCHIGDGDMPEPFTASEVADFIDAHEPGEVLTLPADIGAFLPFGHHRAGAAKEAGIEEIVVVPEYMDLRQMQIRYILENGEEYGQNLQVLIENTAQGLAIITDMLDSAKDYSSFLEQYGDDGKKLYTKNRFNQLKGDAEVSANDIVKLLGSDTIAKKSIEAAFKVLKDEEAGIITREMVFNFPTPRMMGIFGTIVSQINDMASVPEAIRDFYKAHLICEISGDLYQFPSVDDEKYKKLRAKAQQKGPRVTFSQLDGLRRNLAATAKASKESGDAFGIDIVQALKRAMGIKKEGDGAVESAFNLKGALSSEKRCGYRWQDLVEDGKLVGHVAGLTEEANVVEALAELEKAHKKKTETDGAAPAEGDNDAQAAVDAGAGELGDQLPPMEEDEEAADPDQVAQDSLAAFSESGETIKAVLDNLAKFPKVVKKGLEEPEVDMLEEIFVSTAKVLWAHHGNRKSVEELLTKANPNTK